MCVAFLVHSNLPAIVYSYTVIHYQLLNSNTIDTQEDNHSNS